MIGDTIALTFKRYAGGWVLPFHLLHCTIHRCFSSTRIFFGFSDDYDIMTIRKVKSPVTDCQELLEAASRSSRGPRAIIWMKTSTKEAEKASLAEQGQYFCGKAVRVLSAARHRRRV